MQFNAESRRRHASGQQAANRQQYLLVPTAAILAGQ
jgi:hypothetical protein